MARGRTIGSTAVSITLRRAAALAGVALLLTGCSVTRLEDVPTAAALSKGNPGGVADLTMPPDLSPAPTGVKAASAAPDGAAAPMEPITPIVPAAPQDAAAADVPPAAAPAAMPDSVDEQVALDVPVAQKERDVIERPSTDEKAKTATWIGRYTEQGLDAESADGDYCSGRMEWGQGGLAPGRKISVACSDGRLATVELTSRDGGAMNGVVRFKSGTETLRVLNPG